MLHWPARSTAATRFCKASHTAARLPKLLRLSWALGSLNAAPRSARAKLQQFLPVRSRPEKFLLCRDELFAMGITRHDIDAAGIGHDPPIEADFFYRPPPLSRYLTPLALNLSVRGCGGGQ